MTVQLLPFQQHGAAFLAARPRALLADEMRVGKTYQAVAAAETVRAAEVLVVCPAIARPVWLRAFEAGSGRPGYAITSQQTPIRPSPLTVVNYELLIQPEVYRQLARPYDAVILDEAHYCKDLMSKRTQAAYAIVNGARHAWALTGTPTPNYRDELYPLLYSFGRIHYDPTTFVNKFCVTIDSGYGRKIVGNRNDADWAQLLDGFMLRRLLAEVAPQMPKARWSAVPVEAGEVPDFLGYDELVGLAYAEQKRLEARLSEARELLDLLEPEAAANFRRLVGLQKVEPVAEILSSELDRGLKKVVVFGWHDDVLRALQRKLCRYDARLVNGKVKHSDREAAITAFQQAGCRVLICNIQAAGTAIDLSVADDLCFIEEDWVPDNNQQAAMRCVSQFKTRPVFIRSFVLYGSADEQVQRLNRKKISLKTSMFDTSIAYHATK